MATYQMELHKQEMHMMKEVRTLNQRHTYQQT
jgi:hypothetical protein